MAGTALPGPATSAKKISPIKRWLLKGHIREIEGPYEKEDEHHAHSWWQVMCLTGVDYFSTLGYQPGIAAVAAGALSPIATLVLVLLTLFGALPMYKRVANESPYGDGSISMLERLLPWWQGKLFVLCLIGFAATGFIITITLSAADATAHIIENPFAPHFLHGKEIAVTFVLILLLGAVFLKGFGEAIGIAVFLVAAYIAMNLIVVGTGFFQIAQNPSVLTDWRTRLFAAPHDNVFLIIGFSLLVFPKLALGLSGFETGVVVMPLVKGDPSDTENNPAGRIRNTHKLLTSAALIMSVLLMSSSLVTTTLIPVEAFQEATATQPAGEASGRALAYLAHKYLGTAFGTAYDISTVLILWFAGSSAMAGLLNIVPRYLPRYGMAPDWTQATRPLVLIFTAMCLGVTLMFRADVEAQAGAYATGVLALMTSATVAVTLSTFRKGQRRAAAGFGLVTLIFIYTTFVTIKADPEGLRIAALFIGFIITTSLVSRVWRSTELRVEKIEMDANAQRFIDEAFRKSGGDLRIIANRRQTGDEREYRVKEKEQREDNHIPRQDAVLFLEVDVCDASEFADTLYVKGVEIEGARASGQIRGADWYTYRILRVEASTVPNALAAILLHVRDTTGKIPHIYFNWSEGNPLVYLLRFVLFGEGDTAPVTREILRQAEPDPTRRPAIHVG